MIFKASDRIVVLSTSDKQYISSFDINADKIHIIPNAINLNELKKFNSENHDLVSFKTKYGLHGTKIILFVGPVIKRKGVEYLIKAIPAVIQNHKKDNLIFIFTGSGDFFSKAKQLARKLDVVNNVAFTGLLSINDLMLFYKVSDLFILPSFSEGLPTSVLEALYFGLPVVATDIPGVRDHFKDVALLVPPKNRDELAAAIVKLLDEEELAKRLSMAGEELVKSEYTWDVVAGKYEEIYRELILT
jgi:glycosyltransferase involved in cell wall biosynthesis